MCEAEGIDLHTLALVKGTYANPFGPCPKCGSEYLDILPAIGTSLTLQISCNRCNFDLSDNIQINELIDLIEQKLFSLLRDEEEKEEFLLSLRGFRIFRLT